MTVVLVVVVFFNENRSCGVFSPLSLLFFWGMEAGGGGWFGLAFLAFQKAFLFNSNSDITMGIKIKDLAQSEFNPASYKFINHFTAVWQKKLLPFFFFNVDERKGLHSSDIIPWLNPEGKHIWFPFILSVLVYERLLHLECCLVYFEAKIKKKKNQSLWNK